MEQSQILIVVGTVVAIGGGLGATIGTTSMGLFVFYILLLLVGLAVAGYGKKLRDQR